jgi:3-hydroxybutyrate dehydrogenase
MLKGKTALITGSTSGIGYGVALQLAHQGCRILFNGFGEPERIAELQKEYSQVSGQPAVFWGADLSQPSQISKLSSEIPMPDILVNNAGIQHTASVSDFPVEKWDAIIAINLSAAFHLIQKCLPTMRERGWGRIINIASVHGLVASVNKAGYVAAKHGLIGLTKVVALEEARTGVTCNAICPGWVLTPLVQAQIAKKADQEGVSIEIAQERLLGEKQPSLRFTTPQDLGDLVTFLCGSAASNITGSSLTVDGGWTAQ